MPLDNLPSHPKIVTPVDTLWHVSKILAHLQCFTFHGNTFSRGEAPNWRTLTSFTKLLPKITSKIRGWGTFSNRQSPGGDSDLSRSLQVVQETRKWSFSEGLWGCSCPWISHASVSNTNKLTGSLSSAGVRGSFGLSLMSCLEYWFMSPWGKSHTYVIDNSSTDKIFMYVAHLEYGL